MAGRRMMPMRMQQLPTSRGLSSPTNTSFA